MVFVLSDVCPHVEFYFNTWKDGEDVRVHDFVTTAHALCVGLCVDASACISQSTKRVMCRSRYCVLFHSFTALRIALFAFQFPLNVSHLQADEPHFSSLTKAVYALSQASGE